VLNNRKDEFSNKPALYPQVFYRYKKQHVINKEGIQALK